MLARQYLVEGFVQGVGYRWFVRAVAEPLGLTGYVKNLRDGSVEVYAAGSPKALDELRSKLERGPYGARVTAVHESPAPLRDYPTFIITH
jgi:acylphosphatase